MHLTVFLFFYSCFLSEYLRRRGNSLLIRLARRRPALMALNIRGNYYLEMRRMTEADGLFSK